MTSSNENIFRVTGLLWGEFTGHRWIPLTKASDAELWFFSLICAWIKGWVNNREAGVLIRHRAHYDVVVMSVLWHRAWGNMGYCKMESRCHTAIPLRWRHNGHDSVSNHQTRDCFLNHLFRHRSKKTSKLRVTGFCVGNSPGTGEFPAQMASNAENVSIWWRHHDTIISYVTRESYWVVFSVYYEQLKKLTSLQQELNCTQMMFRRSSTIVVRKQSALLVLVRGIHRWAWETSMRLQCRHNGRDCVSNHQPQDCLLNLLFRRRLKKT